MKFEITGFDELNRELDEVSRAVEALDGTIANIQFDPEDEASVARAIREMEAAVDRKVRRYRSNPIVADIAQQLKATYRQELRKRR